LEAPTISLPAHEQPAEPIPAGADRTAAAPRGVARPFIPSIEGFRGYATLIVVLAHAYLASGAPALDGGPIRRVIVGGLVDPFFVISGFVLFLPAVMRKGNLGSKRAYALRRAARIVPPYYLSLVAVFALSPLLFTPADHFALPFKDPGTTLSLVMHLLFLQNFVILLHQNIGFGNGIIWTLPLEVVFYALLPVVALVFYRHPFRMLAASLAAGASWKFTIAKLPFLLGWLGVDFDPKWVYLLQISLTHAPSYCGEFALGMTAAWIYVRLAGLRRRPHPAMVVAVMTISALGVLKGLAAQGSDRLAGGPNQMTLKGTGMAFWFALLILATLFAPKWAQWPSTNRAIRGLGTVSYGVYLSHLLFIRLALLRLGFASDGSARSFLALLAFVLAASAATGWLSYRFVERPVRRWAVRMTAPA
jgi:peptidoglycan/LPS O-acetylase OafA/YrhL